MELLYLWVEDYKNIQKQGFNFSPRFSCEYDEDSNELTIDENDDYIPNFFGDNINVTAIVGKNGSGKSSIVESLLKIRKTLIDGKDDKQSDIDGFIVFESNEELNIVSNKRIIVSKNIKESNQYFENNMPSTKKIVFSLLNVFHKIKIEETYYIQRNNPSLQFNTYELDKRHLEVIKKFSNLLKTVNTKYYFDTVKVDFVESKRVYPDEYDFFNSGLKDFIRNSYFNNENLSLDKFLAHNMLISLLNYFIRNREVISDAMDIYPIELFNQFIPLFFEYDKYSDYELFSKKYVEFLNEIANDIKKTEKSDIQIVYSEIQIIKTKIIFLQMFFVKKISFNFKNNNGFFNLLKNPIYTQNFNISSDNEELLDLLNNFTNMDDNIEEFNFSQIEIINKKMNISYLNLSDGEKQIFVIIIDIIFVLSNQLFGNNQVVILDEIDAHLHPNWIKELLSILIQLTEEFNSLYDKTNVHFLLITHSPFLLSDIPKQNIIFLDKDEKGNCKVVDGLKKKKQTFGANIHTLLSDSFFMEDGLMGEFAKGKINEIIDFHKKVEEEKKKEKSSFSALKTEYEKFKIKFWQTQSIIGEEYLKQVIKNHLVEIEKILLGKDKAKEEEIKRVETYLKSLQDD